MFKFNRFKLLGVAAVLVALLTAVGGLVISQAAGGQGGIRATVYNDAVRFVVQNEQVSILRAEVFDLGGKRLFDSGPVMGNALDWAMTTEAGERAAHGVYFPSAQFFSDVALQDLTPRTEMLHGMKDKAAEVKLA